MLPAGMHVDVLVAGGGVAGLMLARALRQRQRSVLVANDPASPPAGQAAVGVLNPVIGQRFTLAWQAGVALPFARAAYAALAREHRNGLWRDLPIVRVLRTDDEVATWSTRTAALTAAGFEIRADAAVPRGFNAGARPAIAIHGGGVVHVARLLDTLRSELVAAGAWLDRRCELDQLSLDANRIAWPDVNLTADALVLAGGAADLRPGGNLNVAVNAGLGPAVPVRPVHGESLELRAPALADDAVLAHGHFLAPRGDGGWTCGATQQPGRDETAPSAAGRAELEDFLRRHVTVPWSITNHHAGVRPATPDQRPLAGRWLPHAPVYVFNGFGSRGFALAPWLADVFAAHLAEGAPLPGEVSPGRFAPAPPQVSRWHAVDVARNEALLRVRPGEDVVDLTVGNGGDTVWLAEAVGRHGRVWGFDVQPAAIAATEHRIRAGEIETEVILLCTDHARLDAFVQSPIGVAVANLGHLPGSNSPIITRPATTLRAFQAALRALRPGGALIAVAYPGHPGGREEMEALERWAATLDTAEAHVTWHRHPGGVRHAPAVLVVEKV